MRDAKRLGILIVIAVAAGCGRLSLPTLQDSREAQVRASLRTTVRSSTPPPFVTRDGDGTRLWKQAKAFYAERDYVPAWIDGWKKPSANMLSLVSAVQAASDEGLDPELYSAGVLDGKIQEASRGFISKKGFEPEEAGRVDAWLTYLYLRYASDLADGIADLAKADPAWQIKPEKFDAASHLRKALQTGRVTESLAALVPTAPQYLAVRKVLADYRAVSRQGGWPKVPVSTRSKPGDRGTAVAAIAARLAASGDFQGRVPSPQRAVYDATLREAVKRFQRRHGLPDTGTVGADVVAQMNVPIERRIRQVELNMERWRWLPRDLGDEYIVVNIPEMRLEAWERGRVALSMRVVVGKKDTPTPIFNDRMEYVVFSPYWNVPSTIAEKETLPEMLKDPEFLVRANMEIVDSTGTPVDPTTIDLGSPQEYRFRQRPGLTNSLGLVKFMFPNQFDVYLHDTPADSLFGRASRMFSHGCVRVEEPEKLAAYVLRDQPQWTAARIAESMHAGEEQVVKLRRKLPVYLGYWTVNVSPDGLVQFREDGYGVDARQTIKLADRLERMRKSAASAVKVARRER